MTFVLHESIPVWGIPNTNALAQLKNCLEHERAVAGALMADHHLGYIQPIGGIIAYEDAISPTGVGYDIACGNKAVRLDISAEEIRNNISKILKDITKNISFGVGGTNKNAPEHDLFHDNTWKIKPLLKWKKLAANQLGTIGGGNHYVDLFVDNKNRIWLGVHFGSRGLGYQIATHYIKAAGGKPNDIYPVVLDINDNLAQDYLAAMKLAGKYAYAGRNWVCNKITSMLGANILEEIHNHHNYAWYEKHNHKHLWIVRKGATPAHPQQKCFIGGSMGDISVIVKGLDSLESKKALHSTIHGAGRVISRTKAAGKYRSGKRIGGTISYNMMHKWMKDKNIHLEGGSPDESPHCYRRLEDVLEYHNSTIQVTDTLYPVGVVMSH